MNEPVWERLKFDKLAPNLVLRALLFSDPKRAVFRGGLADDSADAHDVLVQLFLEDEKCAEERVNRFLEAKYFDHPHLLRYLQVGTFSRSEGIITYAVTEPADESGRRSLTAKDALEFAQHVLSGLKYLHDRNLLYCVLSPNTVVSERTNWKLSDFSQLRVAGTDTGDEALSLASKLDTSPPEAEEGLFSPAWDVWSFGQTLRKLLSGETRAMTDAFRPIFLACLNINPSSRPTLDQLSGLLESTRLSDREHGISAAAGL